MPSKPPTHKPAHYRTLTQRAKDYDRKRKANPALAEAARVRGSAAYQYFRAWFRDTYPLCCDPFGDHGSVLTPMEQVHHVRGLQAHPEDVCDDRYCAPLCARCHTRCEVEERQGKAVRVTFDGWRERWPYEETK